MNAFGRLIATIGFSLLSAQAAAVKPVQFAFTLPDAMGTSYTAIDAATNLQVDVSAWSSSSGTASAPATLSFAADGLGVCNGAEAGCTPTNTLGALGNNAGTDMILFSFNAPVSLRTLSVSQYSGNSANLTLWAGTGALPAGTLPANLGTAVSFSIPGSTQNAIVDLKLDTSFKADYDWVAVSAMLGATNDLARLRALTVQVNPQAMPVPDPATWMTMLAGLGLVGFAVNRRTHG